MNKRLLLVDDDCSLVNTLRRNLSREFDVTTANSGTEALPIIKDSPEFGVIMVDMRMPMMTGVELIQAARPFSKDAVYMMLTGNQDVTTAAAAVNDGHVFRFLNKPCEIGALKKSLVAAFEQYRLVTAEKELLHKTFVGAIEVMSDVIEASQDDIGSAQMIDQTFISFTMVMGHSISWEHRTATKLALVGMPVLAADTRKLISTQPLTSPQLQEALNEIARISSRLIGHIPRLEPVSKIILAQANSDGEVNPEKCDIKSSASLLKTSVYWELLRRRKMAHADRISQLKELMPKLPQELFELLEEAEEQDRDAPVEIGSAALREGMVLQADYCNSEGMLIVAKGCRLSGTMVEKLQHITARDSHVTFKVSPESMSGSELANS